jgi:hypothetical protein
LPAGRLFFPRIRSAAETERKREQRRDGCSKGGLKTAHFARHAGSDDRRGGAGQLYIAGEGPAHLEIAAKIPFTP